MSYAVTRADIEARWRPLDVEEQIPADTLIADAEDILDNQLPTLAASFGDGGRLDRLVTMTICNMVIRVLRNPDAMRQQSVGDVQQTFGGPEYDGRLYVSLDELGLIEDALLALNPQAAPMGAFSFDPTRAKLAAAARRVPWRQSLRPR